MFIHKIKISGFNSPRSKGISSGNVTLQTETGPMTIRLALPRYLEMSKSRDRLFVLSEALSAARRLPQWRGKGPVHFAPGLLPQELRRIA